jgi:beta-lactamase class A
MGFGFTHGARLRRAGHRPSHARSLLTVVVVGIILTGCGSAPTASPTASGTASAAPSAAASGASPAASPAAGGSPSGAASASPSAGPTGPITLPTTPAGTRLQWVLDVINGGGANLTPAQANEAFAPSFLAQVPVDQLIAALGQVAAAGPFTVGSYTPGPDALRAEARLDGAAAGLSVGIAVDAAPPNRIVGLLFRPVAADPSASPAASWDEIDTALRGLVSEPAMLAAEITDGRCVPIHALDADTSRAIGSTFKLYVLGELTREVSAGTVAWEEQLAIRDDWKSLPSGTMQDESAGTKHTLAWFATQMISISDNTAADHVLHRLGREDVEKNLSAMGLADPSRMTPFPATRDLFVLKATKNANLAEEYLAADSAGRRALLDGRVAATPIALADLADWTSPRAIDTLEWFASTSDLCAAMANLQGLGVQPGLGEALATLAVNPGMPVDRERWPFVGFKGGSEPGVLQLTWLLRRADERWFALSMTLDDPASASDHSVAAVSLAQGALNLLAAVP